MLKNTKILVQKARKFLVKKTKIISGFTEANAKTCTIAKAMRKLAYKNPKTWDDHLYTELYLY